MYVSDVYRFAYWLAGNIPDAEDITSETFVRAWLRSDTIRTETLKAYLLQTARNIYLEQIRKQKRHTKLEDSYPDTKPGPMDLAEEHAELAMVRRVLQTIPEIDRAAFILRVQQELTYDEIARVLRLSLSAAKVKVHRARKKLLTARLSEEEV